MQIFAQPAASAVMRLLSDSGLPTADITAHHSVTFFGCGTGSELEGVVGLELYGDSALLRSLAVSPKRRGAGWGSRLVAHAEGYARNQGVASLYLLTTTAEPFFRQRGYACLPRTEAPEAIKNTQEFASICPVSSAFMFKRLI